MMIRTQILFPLAGVLVCTCLAMPAGAQPTMQPAPPATNPAAGLLGERFDSTAAGISFLPPAGCKMINKPTADELVEYINEEQSWILRVTRSQLPTPMALQTISDPRTKQEVRGLLDQTVAQMIDVINPKILRKDIINVGENDVGLVVARYSMGADWWLRQQAIFQVNDRLYYIFNLTTPTVRPEDQPAGPVARGAPVADINPKEKIAVETFNAMLDSIKLIDRTAIWADQNQRLYRTRALFLSWTPEYCANVIQEKQYFITRRDAKPVGYSFMEEQPDALDGSPGVNIYLRSRNFVDKDTQVEAASKMFTTYDLKHEKWANVAIIKDGAGTVKDHSSEWGDSDYKQHRVFDEHIGLPDEKDARAPKNLLVGSRTLDVVYFGKKSTAPPFHQELPAFYITQAAGQLLPHLVPHDEQKTYLFACYVNESHEVMFRYLDVSVDRETVFNGRHLRATIISDRIGLEGSPTLHYFEFDGKYHYIGSENKASKMVVVPSDSASILQLWPDAVLARSEETEHRPEESKPGRDDSSPVQRGMPEPIR